MAKDKLSYNEIMDALEQASDNDLIDEVERRGYYIHDETDDLLVDASDSTLIDEVESRGYYVGEGFIDILHRWQRGDKKESLLLLERELPEFYGISKLVN